MRRVPAWMLIPVGLAGVALGILLVLSLHWLNATGMPVPTGAVAGSLPSASTSSVGLPRADLTPGAINPAATQQNLADTVCKSGWATSVRPPVGLHRARSSSPRSVQYGYADKNPSALPGGPPRAARARRSAARSGETSGPSRTPAPCSDGTASRQQAEGRPRGLPARQGVRRVDAASRCATQHRAGLGRYLGEGWSAISVA